MNDFHTFNDRKNSSLSKFAGMIPGPTILYQCPNGKNILSRVSNPGVGGFGHKWLTGFRQVTLNRFI
jgi:hypothetical protein